MCGIVGFCSFDRDYTARYDFWGNALVAMRWAVVHRGSDDEGDYLRKNVGLGHARLSIRDLENGAQPMLRTAQRGEYAIVHNGEIYNTQELRAELEAAGYTFETMTDTEVILHGYMHSGIDFIGRLNGIFAFAIWDGAQQKLFLCRDRVGVKPLFYTVKDGELVFGSELKALFRHPEVKPEISTDSFREIFGVGPARTSGVGVFKGINEVRPGHWAEFSADGFAERRYWELESREHTDSYEDTVDTVSQLVRDSVTRQMVSDVPVCSFLSGGVDSGIVTAIAAKKLEEEGGVLNTFSFDFAGNDEHFKSNAFQPERDRPYVDRMLATINVNHSYLFCDEAELAELLIPAMRAKDLPGMADVDASLLYFCRLVRRHNKVALTGECADEIFGGYPWFYREELLTGDCFPWSRDMEARTALLRDDVIEKLQLKDYADARYRETLSAVPRLDGEDGLDARRREISYLNIKWFMQTLLDRMDRTSMSCGLEARVPFADHRIIEYAFNVPWSMKYREGEEKALLRDACGDLLPHEILHRKKSPYPKTYDPRYERLLSEKLTALLDNPNSPVLELVDREKALRFISAPSEYGRPWFGQLMAAPQMLAYILQVSAWLEEYNPTFVQ